MQWAGVDPFGVGSGWSWGTVKLTSWLWQYIQVCWVFDQQTFLSLYCLTNR